VVVAKKFLQEIEDLHENVRASCVETCQVFHSDVGSLGESSTSMISKYEVGLEKLTTTEQLVEGLKQDIILLQPELVEKTQKSW